MQDTEKRKLNGLLLLDKPIGLTSNQTLQRAKRLCCAHKAGHTGSLDRLATGLLPICFGQATKFSAFLLDADKRYQVRCRLGSTTDTGDTEGKERESRPVPILSDHKVKKLLQKFEGAQLQVPPMYSAVSQQGQRLYQLARRGITVERKARPITIHAITLLGMEKDYIDLEVHCSKGTYIRVLVEDIGEELGCGAHTDALRRLAVDNFSVKEAVTLEELEKITEEEILSRLIMPDKILHKLPEIQLTAEMACYFLTGRMVMVPRAPQSGLLRVYRDTTGAFLGVGTMTEDGRIAPKRLMQEGEVR